MVKQCKVIIGSNYGDEGKGLATRYFSLQAAKQKQSCLNILFNGGCQRGHTVDLLNGDRHIFHHFGAGTFDGADTYFDENFMVNPIIFNEEHESLLKQHQSPKCYIHPYCMVSTPYDAFVNQIVEISRGNKRHGSCGFGIWETKTRYSREYNLRYVDLCEMNRSQHYAYLTQIADWSIKKLEEIYGIKDIPEEYRNLFDSDDLKNKYIRDFYDMKNIVSLCSINGLSRKYDVIIFEGAQGLELDEDKKENRPHVTASKTTAAYPIECISKIPAEYDIEVCYVTRSYLTRHGAGSLPTECNKDEINPDIVDETNTPNTWQGALRFGKLDRDRLIKNVYHDISISVICNRDVIFKDKTFSLFATHLNYADIDKQVFQEFDKAYLSSTKYAEDVRLLDNGAIVITSE